MYYINFFSIYSRYTIYINLLYILGQENGALFQHVRGFNHRINFDLSSVIKCNSNFTEKKYYTICHHSNS